MGFWGVGIFDNDVALDVRDYYNELLQEGLDDNKIAKQIEGFFKEDIKDLDTQMDVYLALSTIQLSRSNLHSEIRNKTISLIDQKAGMQLWANKKKNDYNKRIKLLEKCKKILLKAPSSSNDLLSGNNTNINIEENEPPFSVYKINDQNGQQVYVGSTRFQKKRLRFMDFFQFGNKIEPNQREKFWKWFSNNEMKLFKAKDMRNDPIFEKLSKKLKEFHPNLVFEIGNEGEKKSIAISCDGSSKAFPYVMDLMNEPIMTSHWLIYPFRQRKDIKKIKFKMNNKVMSSDDILFISTQEKNFINLDLYVKDFRGKNDPILNIVFIFLDSAIGEYNMITKVKKLNFKPISALENNSNALPLDELSRIVDLVE